MALWRSQSIQVVWFLTESDLNVDSFYNGLFGSEPDRVERNKVPSPSNPYLGVASGVVDGLSATIQLTPGRVDLVIQPDPSNPDEVFPELLNSEDVIAWLSMRFVNASAHFPIAIRIAVVCNFLKTAATDDEARAEVSALIGLDHRLQSYSDLMFQINRRSISERSGVEINRLLRWATVVFQSVVVNLQSQPGGFAGTANLEQHASSFVVDLNTVFGTRPFERAEQVSIFQEMLEELSRLGDDRTPLALMPEQKQVH